jgi:hypothetical protein
MKPYILALLVLLAATASAQEDLTITIPAAELPHLINQVATTNVETCERLHLAVTCTQAQACVAAAAVGGASCTAAQARAADARIFPATTAGRSEYVTFRLVAPQVEAAKPRVTARNKKRMCVWFNGLNQTQKDAECVKHDSPAGCDAGCNGN